MAYPIPEVRPAVISSDLRQRLSDYLRFRHLFRNIYGRELRWDLLRSLADGLPEVHRAFTIAVQEFSGFLLTLGK